jgi:hypothetical protein
MDTAACRPAEPHLSQYCCQQSESPCAALVQIDNIALLDLLCSFSSFIAQSPGELVRPKVEEGAPLAIVQVRG